MFITIGRKTITNLSMVPHHPQHHQTTQLVKPITVINKCCVSKIRFLSQEPCGFQFQKTSPLSLVHTYLYLHPQNICQDYFHFIYLHSDILRPALSSCLL